MFWIQRTSMVVASNPCFFHRVLYHLALVIVSSWPFPRQPPGRENPHLPRMRLLNQVGKESLWRSKAWMDPPLSSRLAMMQPSKMCTNTPRRKLRWNQAGNCCWLRAALSWIIPNRCCSKWRVGKLVSLSKKSVWMTLQKAFGTPSKLRPKKVWLLKMWTPYMELQLFQCTLAHVSIRAWQVSHCQAACRPWPLGMSSIRVWQVSHCQAACRPWPLDFCSIKAWLVSHCQVACRPWPLVASSIRVWQESHCRTVWRPWPLEVCSIRAWPVSHCQAACRPWPLGTSSIKVWQVSHCRAAFRSWHWGRISIRVWQVLHYQAACRPWPLGMGAITAWRESHCEAACRPWPLEGCSIRVWQESHCQAACRRWRLEVCSIRVW